MLLFIVQKKKALTNVHIFKRPIIIQHFRNLYEVVIMSLPPHKFVRQFCGFYWVRKLKSSKLEWLPVA